MLKKSLHTAMLKRKSELLIAVVMLLLVACSSTKKTTTTKQVAPPTRKTLPPLPESVLNLPVKIAIRPFLLQAETLAPKEITSTGWPEYINSSCDFRYKYRFIRSGFQFSCTNNRISVNMNGNYQIAGSKTVCVLDKAVYPWVNGSCGFGNEPMRKVNINLVSNLQFTPDYHLQTFTRVDKVQAIDKCLVTVFKNDVTTEILDSIAASVNEFGKNIDAMMGTMNFDKALSPIAEKAGKKIPLSTYALIG